MLKFIVLGQIPGTSFQINFYSFTILVGVATILALARLYFYDRRRRAIKQLASLLTVL